MFPIYRRHIIFTLVFYFNVITEDETEGSKKFPLLDGSGYVTRRTVRRIIRFRHFNKSEAVDYWREQLMLFVPWRDEDNELVNVDPIKKSQDLMETILKNSKPYYSSREVDEHVLGNYINELENEDDEQGPVVQNEMECAEDEEYAQNILKGKTSKSIGVERFLLPKLIEDQKYFQIMQSLNRKQHKIVMDILHRLKTDQTPFHIFMTGGAGVGKSHVITAIVQSYIRHCNRLPGIPPEDPNVIVCAPTGKAAFNVFGMTLHCAFKLPPSQYGGDIAPLSDSAANSLRIKYKFVKLFIIDEISMVSARQFAQIDRRLRQLFNPDLPFGGKSILVVGHLRQLAPIPGGTRHHIFKTDPSCGLANIVPRNPDWEMFSFYELDEIMRQKGDHAFCKALNNMSEGCMDEEDICLIKSREISTTVIPPPEAIWLFPYNQECRQHNAKIHSNLDTEGAMSTAHDKVIGKILREI